MTTIDVDLCSIQEARDLVRNGKVAAECVYSDEQIDLI